MKAKTSTIEEIFKDGHYVVPQYQRYYSWVEKECDQIVSDITSIFETTNNKNSKHFMGNVVIKENGNINEIIDGQQRLTTLVLIAKAIISTCSDVLDESTINELNDIFLEDKTTIKLTLTNGEKDNQTFQKILKDELLNIRKDSKLYINYLHLEKVMLEIKERFKKENLDFNKFAKVFLSLDFVVVTLQENDDNAQNVFESLNSKGRELDAIDLIKNYIFMNIKDTRVQDQLYSSYWSDMEKNLGFKEMSTFVRFYSILKNKPNKRSYIGTSPKEVYEAFKEVFPSLNSEKEISSLLEDMNSWHYLYLCASVSSKNVYSVKETVRHLAQYDKYNEIINTCEKLTTKDTSDLMPFIYLYSAKYYFDGKINNKQFETMIKMFENYYTRWFICSGTGNLLNPLTEFANAFDDKLQNKSPKEVNKSTKWMVDLINDINKKSNSSQFKFFDNVQVLNSLVSSKKNLKGNKIIPLLEMVEREITHSDIVFDSYSLNKEHIIPQSYVGAKNNGWTEALNAEDKKDYDAFVGQLGNFMLLDKTINKELGDKPFSEKISILSNPDEYVNSAKEKKSLYITAMSQEFLEFCKKYKIEEWDSNWIAKWNEEFISPKIIKYISSTSFEG